MESLKRMWSKSRSVYPEVDSKWQIGCIALQPVFLGGAGLENNKEGLKKYQGIQFNLFIVSNWLLRDWQICFRLFAPYI